MKSKLQYLDFQRAEWLEDRYVLQYFLTGPITE